MKKFLLTILAALPFLVNAQRTVVFQQDFDSNVSNKVADYKLTSAGGSLIADNKSTRFESFGATTAPTGITYSIDEDGLKITRTAVGNQVMAQVKGLAPSNGASADVAFIQFNLSIQTNTQFLASGSTPLFVFAGQGFGSNSNTDDHSTNAYMPLAFYFPTASADEFGIKVGSTATGNTYSGPQKITWVINRTANPVTYKGPSGSSSTVQPASYDVWVGTTKHDLSAGTITPGQASKPITDFRIRQGATWSGYTAFKDVNIGYLQTDGSGDTQDSDNYVFSQAFDNTASTILLDYLLSSNIGNVPAGTAGGPIANDARLSSIPNRSQQTTAGYYYSVDADGFKFNRGTSADIKQTAHVSGLAIPDNGVAFAEFDFTPNQGATYTSFTPLTFYLGQGYTNTSADQGTLHYQSLGIKFHSASQFRFGDNTDYLFSGTKKILWVVNRNTDAVNYTGPDNNTYTLTANGGYNVWVDGVRLETGGVALGQGAAPGNAAPQIKDFRIRLAAPWGAAGSVAVKNLKIGYMDFQVLPVKLTNFTAKTNGSSVNLNWQTATESNFSHFDVTRSTDGANFVKIGERVAKGPSTYSYTDFSPAKGYNYYQLISQDKDGKSEKSEIVTAKVAATALEVNVESSSAQAVELGISTLKGGKAKISLANISGQVIANTDATLNIGYNKVSVATTYKGVIIATVTTAEASISKKTIK